MALQIVVDRKAQVTLINAPIDGDNNICGVTKGYEDSPYLFVTKPSIKYNLELGQGKYESGVCVSSCPSSSSDSLEDCIDTSEYSCSSATYATTLSGTYCDEGTDEGIDGADVVKS